jgi:hypothetical protein
MKKFWNIFWKAFVGLLALIVIAAIVIGVVLHSSETVFIILRATFSLGLGLCGVIGFIVVPIEMYVEYHQTKGVRETNNELV